MKFVLGICFTPTRHLDNEKKITDHEGMYPAVHAPLESLDRQPMFGNWRDCKFFLARRKILQLLSMRKDSAVHTYAVLGEGGNRKAGITCHWTDGKGGGLADRPRGWH